MPEMHGVGLAFAVSKLFPQVPIVICTGYSDQFSEDDFEQAGVDMDVQKPINGRQLARTLYRLLC